MKERQIVTLMHKLFYGDIDTSDGYVHLFTDGTLDREKFEHFIRGYIQDRNLLIYVNSQRVFSCSLIDAYEIVKANLSDNRVRIANEAFSARIIIEPTGVAVGHLTNKGIGREKRTHFSNVIYRKDYDEP